MRASSRSVVSRAPRSRVAVSIAVSGAVAALSGCTAGTDEGSPRLTPSMTTSSAPITDVFAGPEPVSALDFWADNPRKKPDSVKGQSTVLDQQGEGPAEYSLPSDRLDQLTLVLTCTTPVAYELEVLDQSGEQVAWTKGESCGGPNIGLFTSAPIDPTSTLDRLKVHVAEGTKYDVVVLGDLLNQETEG